MLWHDRITVKYFQGDTVVAQGVMNPTSTYEDEGSIPGLTEWVNCLALLQAM